MLRGVLKLDIIIQYLNPGNHGKYKEKEDGKYLSAGEQLLRLLPELHVHQEERHLFLGSNFDVAWLKKLVQVCD